MDRLRPRALVHLTTAGFAWLLLAGDVGGALAADEGVGTGSDQERLELVLDQGVLTLQAQDVPLADVLRAIGERAGFEVSVQGAADVPISADLADVPLEEALRRLLRNGSFAFFHDRPRGDPARRLVEVRVRLFEEAAAPPDRDRAASAGSEVPATSEGSMRQDGEAAPSISPYDSLEDRLEFARIEARAGKPKSAEDLMTLLLEDEHANIRGLAASALGRLGGPEAGEALANALADRDREVRRRAARALGEVWGEQAVEPLAGLLITERARGVRRVAAYSLSRIGGEAALQALEPLQFDLDPQMRRIATLALEAAED